MSEANNGSEFLKQKYNLHNTPEVESAAQRTQARTGERVSQNPLSRIDNYLDRLQELVLDPEKKQERKTFEGESRPRALGILREMIMNKYVHPHKENMAKGAAKIEERAARQMGMDIQYGDEQLEQRGEIAIQDLEASLDQWISYFSDANEPYPAWFRYYAFRNTLNLSDYDKDKGEFPKRSSGTVRLFPEIDRGALAYVQQMMEAAKDKNMFERLLQAQNAVETPKDQLLTEKQVKAFANLSFAKQYAEGIKQSGEITPEMREETEGRWVKYQQGTDPTALWASLQNKGTSWCTKGFATAEEQLKNGDFYVYYTLDKKGESTIPRIAIRMQASQIAEVRGVADTDQNLEGNIGTIAEEKMEELPGAERYKKATSDMKLLTAIERKMHAGEELSKNELIFIYEINASIDGFGYRKDPRIAELQSQRNPETDMPIVFECRPEQIARSVDQINQHTRAYVGELVPGIFQKLPDNIEHIYTSFPERIIRREKADIGGKTSKQLQNEMEQANIKISSYAKEMMENSDFVTLKDPEEINLVQLSVADLGLSGHPTTDEIYARIEELGLELCPAELGPHYRLQNLDQPVGDWRYVGMKQITVAGGRPSVFRLERYGGGLWLRGSWARPVNEWGSGHRFLFRLRK